MPVDYNERAWGADLVAELARLVEAGSSRIKRVGSELSVRRKGKSTLFPDVLLFTDDVCLSPACGWELKLPDTDIGDQDLHSNVREKASRLQTNAYVVWNYKTAELWVQEDTDGEFTRHQTWKIPNCETRADVTADRSEWKVIAAEIYQSVCELLARGSLRIPAITDVLGNTERGLLTELATLLEPQVAEQIRKDMTRDQEVRAAADVWWLQHKQEYPSFQNDSDPAEPLAGTVVSLWLNRYILAHLLQASHPEVDEVIHGKLESAEAATFAFQKLQETTDFATIFGHQLADTAVPEEAWERLDEFNEFLTQVRIGSATEAFGQSWLDAISGTTARRAVGQFRTPDRLADLVAALAIRDIQEDIIWDPCCGSGTIPSAALQLKLDHGVDSESAYQDVWLSDKYATPLQAAQMAMITPQALGQIVRIFQGDFFKSEPGNAVVLRNPETGKDVDAEIPQPDAFLMNAPFVRFELVAAENPYANDVIAELKAADYDCGLDGRADLYAYVAGRVAAVAKPGSIMAMVTSNSWLGTKAGKTFYDLIKQFFEIRYVVISGKGRWFRNADVVGTILVAERKGSSSDGQHPIKFVTTNARVEDLSRDEVRTLANEIIASSDDGVVTSGRAKVTLQTPSSIAQIRNDGLSLCAAFTNTDWLGAISDKLVPIGQLAEVSRGERRGWNPLFYPPEGTDIESDYLAPALLSSASQSGYFAEVDAQAFTCDMTIDELKDRGHTGALNWIQSFSQVRNGTGKLLTDLLASSKRRWYEMSRDVTADFVSSMNPSDRLFVQRFLEPAFVDQRLMRISAVEGVDRELLHALLNLSTSMFFIESSGFGRGLGALDVNPTNLKEALRVPDPNLIDSDARAVIIETFAKVTDREVMTVEDELRDEARLAFEASVVAAYGIDEEAFEMARAALSELRSIRVAATN